MALFGGKKPSGQHSGSPASEPKTDQGTPFGEMSGEQKAGEFDASTSDPQGYAQRNFSDTGQASEKGRGRHRK